MVRNAFPGWSRRRIGLLSLALALTLSACGAASAGTRPDGLTKRSDLGLDRSTACAPATSLRPIASGAASAGLGSGSNGSAIAGVAIQHVAGSIGSAQGARKVAGVAVEDQAESAAPTSSGGRAVLRVATAAGPAQARSIAGTPSGATDGCS